MQPVASKPHAFADRSRADTGPLRRAFCSLNRLQPTQPPSNISIAPQAQTGWLSRGSFSTISVMVLSAPVDRWQPHFEAAYRHGDFPTDRMALSGRQASYGKRSETDPKRKSAETNELPESRSTTFELKRDRRQTNRPGSEKMHRAPLPRVCWLDVGSRLERRRLSSVRWYFDGWFGVSCLLGE